MARAPFPTRADFGRNLSGAVLQPNHSAETAAGAANDVARAVGHVAGRLREAADRAYERQGESQAVGDIERGGATLRGGLGIEAQAYDGIMREHVLAQRVTAYDASAQEVERAHPNDPVAYAEAMQAVDAAFAPTGDASLDSRFARSRTLALGAGVQRVRVGQAAFRREAAAGALVETVQGQSAVLSRAAAGAPAGETGAAQVGAALTTFTTSLVRFGPRDAFELGGVAYPADPSRLDVMGVDDLARTAAKATEDARGRWIVGVGETITDPAAKRAYVGDVRDMWQSGDPMFAGMSADGIDRALGRLEQDAARAEADIEAQRRGAEASVREGLRAAEFGGAADWGALRAEAAATGNEGLKAEVEYRAAYGFTGSPSGGGRGGAAAPGAGFEGSVNFLLDHLEGPGLVGNDNGQGRAQWGITSGNNPDAWTDGKVDRAEAAQIYRDRYWTPTEAVVRQVGGDEDFMFAAFTIAVVAGPGKAGEMVRASGGDLDRLWALETAHYERLARENPGEYADDLPGWRNRQGKVRGAVGAQRARRREQDGYSGDPLGHAMGTETRPPLISVATLDPNGVFAGANGVPDWKRAVLTRRSQGEALAARDGVPARIFTDAEMTFYAERFEDSPGDLLIFTVALASTVGPDAARPVLLDLGRKGLAPADLHIAGLAMDPVTRPAAGLAVRGRQMRLQGAGEAVFGDDQSIAETTRTLAPAFAAMPDLLPAIENVARDMAVADAAAGRLKAPAAYVNSALGATERGGHTFGGMASWNSGAVILPAWLRRDGVDEWIETEAAAWASGGGPVYANGRPVAPIRLRGYQLRATPGGYRLLNPETGAYAVDAAGRPFQFRPNREAVARRHPPLVTR